MGQCCHYKLRINAQDEVQCKNYGQDAENSQNFDNFSDSSFNKAIQEQVQLEQEQQQQQQYQEEEQLRNQERQILKQVEQLLQLIQAQEKYYIQMRLLEQMQVEDNLNENQLNINISLYYNRKHGQPINHPCKHAKCLTVVNLNCHGMVNCQNGCPSFKIIDAAFEVSKNQIFNKSDEQKYGNFVTIKSRIEMAQILGDSLERSQMNENEQSEFCKNFTKVLCLQFVNQKKTK